MKKLTKILVTITMVGLLTATAISVFETLTVWNMIKYSRETNKVLSTKIITITGDGNITYYPETKTMRFSYGSNHININI